MLKVKGNNCRYSFPFQHPKDKQYRTKKIATQLLTLQSVINHRFANKNLFPQYLLGQ